MANKIYLVTVQYESFLAAFTKKEDADAVAGGYMDSFVDEIVLYESREEFDKGEEK